MSGFVKDPQAVLDFTVDWQGGATPFLATGETIATSTFTVASGLTKDSETNGDTTATVWVSGGTAQTSYLVTNTITTSAGRKDERSFSIRVRNL